MTTADRTRHAAAMMTQYGAPITRANCLRLAEKYAKGYRVSRKSARPPSRALLAGMLSTARAFYTLARAAA